MKLSDLLDSPQAHHVRARPVTFRAIGHNSRGEHVKIEDAKAVFRFVDEDSRARCLKDADKAIGEAYPDGAPPDRRSDERAMHVLYEAMRDPDEPKDRIFGSVLQLKKALVLDEAQRVHAEYESWVLEEFPPALDDESFKKLVEDAKKNCIPDLLTSYGFRSIVTVAAYLARQSGK